jgi:hypothetical protein
VVHLGDIWRIHFPYGDQPGFKMRPVVVVGASPMGHTEEEVVLVAMITSRVHQRRNGDVVIGNYQAAGLPKPSIIKARRLFSASPSMFTYSGGVHLGCVDSVTLESVMNEIAALFSP